MQRLMIKHNLRFLTFNKQSEGINRIIALKSIWKKREIILFERIRQTDTENEVKEENNLDTENDNLESTQTLSKLGSKVRKYRLLELPTKMPFFKSF